MVKISIELESQYAAQRGQHFSILLSFTVSNNVPQIWENSLQIINNKNINNNKSSSSEEKICWDTHTIFSYPALM